MAGIATRLTGMLRKNTQRQPPWSVRRPPRVGPRMLARLNVPVNRPMYFPRSAAHALSQVTVRGRPAVPPLSVPTVGTRVPRSYVAGDDNTGRQAMEKIGRGGRYAAQIARINHPARGAERT